MEVQNGKYNSICTEYAQTPGRPWSKYFYPIWLYEKEIQEFLAKFNEGKESKDQRAVKWSVGEHGSFIRPDIGEFEHYAKVRLNSDGTFVEYIDDHIE